MPTWKRTLLALSLASGVSLAVAVFHVLLGFFLALGMDPDGWKIYSRLLFFDSFNAVATIVAILSGVASFAVGVAYWDPGEDAKPRARRLAKTLCLLGYALMSVRVLWLELSIDHLAVSPNGVGECVLLPWTLVGILLAWPDLRSAREPGGIRPGLPAVRLVSFWVGALSNVLIVVFWVLG